MKSALLVLRLLATTTGVDAKSEFERKLVHCEEVVEQNDDFNIWRRNFEECMADRQKHDPHPSLRSASSFIR